jgi:hypothetical protein
VNVDGIQRQNSSPLCPKKEFLYASDGRLGYPELFWTKWGRREHFQLSGNQTLAIQSLY